MLERLIDNFFAQFAQVPTLQSLTLDPQADQPVTDMDLKRMVRLLFHRRWLVAGVTLSSILVAGVLAFTTTVVYRAQTVLVRADTGEGSRLMGSLISQFGGIAALAGIGEGQDSTATEALALLKSRKFTQDFIAHNNLLPRIFHERWDAARNQWKSARNAPTAGEGYKYFDRKIRHVEENRKTGIVTLQIDWEDPSEAADWANRLVATLNEQMKERAIVEASKTIEYLTRELPNTDVPAVQQVIYRLMEANLKQRALASARGEYVFRIVDPAVTPEKSDKVRPRRSLYLVTGAFFGLILGVLAVLAVEVIGMLRIWVRSENGRG